MGRIKRSKRRLHFMLANDAEEEMMIACYMRLRRARKDLKKMSVRSIKISMTTFKLNRFCEEECFHLFRFRAREIGKIVQLCNWTTGKTRRSGYVADVTTAVCVVLRKLSYPTRWRDIEVMFGMRASAMSEVFYQVLGALVGMHGHLLENFRGDMKAERAEIYAKAIHDKERR